MRPFLRLTWIAFEIDSLQRRSALQLRFQRLKGLNLVVIHLQER